MHVARVELAKFRKTRCLLHLAHAARAIDELSTADAYKRKPPALNQILLCHDVDASPPWGHDPLGQARPDRSFLPAPAAYFRSPPGGSRADD